jgi:hypothetical protein
MRVRVEGPAPPNFFLEWAEDAHVESVGFRRCIRAPFDSAQGRLKVFSRAGGDDVRTPLRSSTCDHSLIDA